MCGHLFEVGASAQSTSCPSCYKPVIVSDIIVNAFKAVTKVQTCGRIVIQKKGRVIAELVVANSGIEVDGIIDAKRVYSAGTVSIGAKAQWKGECHAPAVQIAEGATIANSYFVIPDDSLGLEEELTSKPGLGRSKVRAR